MSGQSLMLPNSLVIPVRLVAACAILLLLSACEVKKHEFWYYTSSTEYVQVDRIGLPYMFEIFDDPEIKTELAKGSPTDDSGELADLIEAEVTDLRAELAATADLSELSATALTPSEVAATLTPNVLVYDLSLDDGASSFNGHSVQDDDAFDAILQLVFGRYDMEDEVAEDLQALTLPFPYLRRQNY